MIPRSLARVGGAGIWRPSFARPPTGFDPLSLFSATRPGLWTRNRPGVDLFQNRYLATPALLSGDPVALRLDSSQGLVLGAELRGTGTVGLTGSATAATYDTGTGAGTCVRVDASNQSWVSIGSLNAAFTYPCVIANTGAIELSIRPGTSGATALAVIASGATATVMFRGNATMVITASAAGTAAFTVQSAQHLAGNHVLSPDDGTGRSAFEFIGPYPVIASDGSGDSFVSPVITPVGDILNVWIAARKLSDATASAYLLSSSTNPPANNGTFAVTHSGSGLANYQSIARGSVAPTALSTPPSYAAPITNVIAIRTQISTDSREIWINGVLVATSALDMGTGDFTAQALYLASRAGTAQFSSSQVGETVMVYGDVTAAERTAMNAYINGTIGAY